MCSRLRVIIVALAATVVCPAGAQAQQFTVTGAADSANPCVGTICPSLRAAISAANANPGPDEVDLGSGNYRIAIGAASPEDMNASGDLDVTDDLTIKGHGAGATTILGDLPMGQGERDIDLHGIASLTLNDLSLAGGRDGENAAYSFGGGIYDESAGTLTLKRAVVHDNSSTGKASWGDGGGLAVGGSGRVVIERAAFLNNYAAGAGFGAAIYFGGTGTTTVTNVTFAGNQATALGGAIDSDASSGSITLAFVTIDGNTVPSGNGGGIGNASQIHLRDSIVDGNSALTAANCSQTPTSDGGNVADPACGLSLSTDAQTLDPRLGSLTGSPIPVFEPLAGSRALDRAVAPCPGTDARGISRPQGRACDAGSAERRVPPPDTRITKTKITSQSGLGTATFRFRARGQFTRFECRLARRHRKAPAFKRCRSPKTYRKLAPGSYSFQVRAVGPAGTDLTPAKERFRIT